MEEGVYRNLKYAEYEKIQAVRSSYFGPLDQSPKHLKAALAEKDVDTKEKRIGRAVHSLILEPTTFGLNYVIKKHDGRSKEGKEEKAKAEQMGATLLPKDEYGIANTAAESVLQDVAVQNILEGAETELTVVWDDETGAKCKARIDIYDEKLGVLYDVKTCKNAGFGLFRKEIADRGYWLQLPFYARGLKKLGLPVNDIVLIAIEKNLPCEFKLYRLEDGIAEMAQFKIEDLLKQYVYCQQSGDWPGYQRSIDDIGLPDWKKTQMEEQYGARI